MQRGDGEGATLSEAIPRTVFRVSPRTAIAQQERSRHCFRNEHHSGQASGLRAIDVVAAPAESLRRAIEIF
jgi:hypothetical protein